MTLKEFIDKQGITITTFAKFIEIPYPTVYSYVVGDRTPSLKVAYKIEKFTKGQVTMKELITEND